MIKLTWTIVLFGIIVMYSCNHRVYELSRKQSPTSVQVVIDHPRDLVEVAAKKFLTTNNLGYKKNLTNDVEIITGMVSNLKYTYERETEESKPSSADILLHRNTLNGKRVDPEKVRGSWRINLTQMSSDETMVKVVLKELDAVRYIEDGPYSSRRNLVYTGYSTGKFEKSLVSWCLDWIEKNPSTTKEEVLAFSKPVQTNRESSNFLTLPRSKVIEELDLVNYLKEGKKVLFRQIVDHRDMISATYDSYKSQELKPKKNEETDPVLIDGFQEKITVQFLASAEANKTFEELSDIGRIIVEKIPSKNIYRYKIGFFQSPTQAELAINQLETRGFLGAFINQ